jgi:hypothetical protein
MEMRRSVAKTLVIALVVSLAGCIPQWSEPVFKSHTATPGWLAGLWVDSSGDEVIRLRARGNDFEYLAMDEKTVFLGAALVTGQNGDLFISIRPRDGKYLSSGPIRAAGAGGLLRLGKVPLSGYFVSYIDRISDEEIRITEIDYYKLFAGLKASKQRLGTDLCRKVPLFAQTLQQQTSSAEPARLEGASAEDATGLSERTSVHHYAGSACDLLDTNAVEQSGGGSMLERSDSSVEYYRVKTPGSSRGNGSSTSP